MHGVQSSQCTFKYEKLQYDYVFMTKINIMTTWLKMHDLFQALLHSLIYSPLT